MAMQFKVPSMVCDGCAETVSKAIKVVDGSAEIDVDLGSKQVSVKSDASEESIREAIIAQGHQIS